MNWIETLKQHVVYTGYSISKNSLPKGCIFPDSADYFDPEFIVDIQFDKLPSKIVLRKKDDNRWYVSDGRLGADLNLKILDNQLAAACVLKNLGGDVPVEEIYIDPYYGKEGDQEGDAYFIPHHNERTGYILIWKFNDWVYLSKGGVDYWIKKHGELTYQVVSLIGEKLEEFEVILYDRYANEYLTLRLIRNICYDKDWEPKLSEVFESRVAALDAIHTRYNIDRQLFMVRERG